MNVNILRYCTGQNNKIDPARIPYDMEKGVADLEACKDILIDQQGGITTARGNLNVLAGSFHSRYPVGDGSFYAIKERDTDSALLRIIPGADGSVTWEGIRDLTQNAKADFCEVDGKVYYMNGYESGVLVGSSSSAWQVSAWPRETGGESMIATPVGHHLDMLSSRFIISIDERLIFTEPGLFGLVDNARSYRRFESRVLLICAVGTGAYISDEQAVWFCSGLDPNQWIPRKVLDYPAIEYGREPGLIDPSMHGLETSTPSALFATVQGPVIGLPDGTPINLINKKVNLPSGFSQGSIMVVDETTIIQSGV